MTPKNRTLEGKNRTLGGRGGQKSSKIVGHHLCTFPNGVTSSFDGACLFLCKIVFNFRTYTERFFYLVKLQKHKNKNAH